MIALDGFRHRYSAKYRYFKGKNFFSTTKNNSYHYNKIEYYHKCFFAIKNISSIFKKIY